MTNLGKFGIATLAVSIAFATGRWTTPVKIKTEIKTVQVTKIVKDKSSKAERKVHRTTTIVEVTQPDGRKQVTTTITEDSDLTKDSKTKEVVDRRKETEKSKEIVSRSSSLTVSALAGAPVSFANAGPLVYGLHVSKQILGPISFGIWGLSNSTGGVSLGLTF